MRSALLWMARDAWLRDHVPELPFAKRAVRRFMPGEQLDDALGAADGLMAQGIGILFTRTGNRGRAKAGLLLNGIVIVVGIIRLSLGDGIV